MSKYIFIFYLFIIPKAFGQSTGDILREEGNLDEAIAAYKEDYTMSPMDSKNTYNLACALALTYSKKDSAFHYLNIALENDNRLWALADNDLISLTEDVRWKNIEAQQLKKYEDKNGLLKQPKYAIQLLQLIMKDQALDYQVDLAKKYFMEKGKIPHWYYPIGQMRKEIASDNFNTLNNLITNYGWPKYSSVGKLSADAPLLIINHHESDSIRVKYIDKIKNACLTKEGSCIEYAKIQDRILVNDGQLQIYGMQFRYDKLNKLEPFPIIDPEYVDQRRFEIGLEPLKDYLKRKINFDWDIKQKKR